ncbi:TRAP transporter small permease [Neptunomonas marina]|uniref:TRAP transporter small permease n=1 Tax=Neptunomonas marina TaxID=1815562 RepID=UPI001F0C5530|nr:TRAP transporter small permease subunit [Neptunomonas marina]
MFTRFAEGLARALLWLASLLLLSGVVVLLYGVGARYLFNASPIWMDELSRYLIIGSVTLAAGTVYVRDEHMRVSVIQKALTGPAAALLSLYHWSLVLVLSSYVTYISYHYAASLAIFKTIGLGISKSVPMFALPIGFAMLCLLALLQGPFGRSADQRAASC